MLWATTLHEVKGRYAGTVLGLAWMVVYPLLFLGLYALVYVLIFQVRVGGFTTFEYVLLIFSGLIPFLGFAESLGYGVSSVVSNKNLIKNMLFPIELIPVKAVLVGSMTMVVGLALLQSILWLRGIFYLSQLLMPFIFVLQLLFTVGLIWLLSALNVFFRDLGQMISVLILFLMLVSPIAYTIDMVPPQLLPIMYPNPLFYLIMLYRETMVVGRVPLGFLLTFLVISIVTFSLGYYVFSRLKVVFADYV
jgi:lipopolysaccharide transport system permease protein